MTDTKRWREREREKYIYIYIYIHTYTYVNIYIYIHILLLSLYRENVREDEREPRGPRPAARTWPTISISVISIIIIISKVLL